jgi:hypothetical protein
MGRCVFCGWEGTLTREHAWPKWIREVLPEGHVKGYSQQHRVAVGTGEVTEITPMLRHKAADREVKVVCQHECNGGWMCDLEGVAKPLLTPLILGDAADLSKHDQKLIAFWVTKTAMMLQFIHPVDLRGIPAAHYQYVTSGRRSRQCACGSPLRPITSIAPPITCGPTSYPARTRRGSDRRRVGGHHPMRTPPSWSSVAWFSPSSVGRSPNVTSRSPRTTGGRQPGNASGPHDQAARSPVPRIRRRRHRARAQMLERGVRGVPTSLIVA